MPNSLKRCYVIMPAGTKNEFHGGKTESYYVYKRIKDGLESEPIAGHKISVVLETDKKEAGAITTSILESLILADICIADLTGHNANVLLELGMRYCFRPGLTVLIAQDISKIPSDIQPQRVIPYSYFEIEKLIKDLQDTIQNDLKEGSSSRKSTSIVHDLIPGAQFTSPLSGATSGVMPCHEYWKRIERIAKELKKLTEQKSYIPSALIGLADGGAAFTDFVGRILGQGRDPILAVGLCEIHESFDNSVNNLTLTGIRDQLQKRSERHNILLLDDYVVSGRFANQAKELIKKLIPGADVHFLPLVCRNKGTLSDLFDQRFLLWAHQAVSRTKEEVEEMHYTDWHTFPNEKVMRGD